MQSKTVGLCDTQPITAEGLRALLDGCPELRFTQAASSLAEGAAIVRSTPPDILLIDKGFGAHAVLAWIADLRERQAQTILVVWGNTITEAEALRYLQNGVRGILRKTADPVSILACLRTVASGSSWMEEALFREPIEDTRYPRSSLTPREQQVLGLVEQGLKNREIARELGIRPGTVKIHLKHIFEKTGVRGRYGLALTGMKSKGLLSMPVPARQPVGPFF